MCVKIMDAAFEVQLPPVLKAVLIVLANHANARKGGLAWPAVSTICRHSGYKERVVRKALSELCLSGNLTAKQVTGKPTQYLVHPCTTCTPAPRAPLHTVPTTPAPHAPKPLEEEPLDVSASALTILPARKSEYPDAFEVIWKAYPRHDGKGAALKAWRSACKRTGQPERLLTAVADYAAHPPDDANFIPHMATWLNQSRYDDERQTNGRQNTATNLQRGKPERNKVTDNPMVLAFARMAGHIDADGNPTQGAGRCDATGAPASSREHSRPAQLALSSVKHH